MVDNPSDLEQPRSETPPYTARRSAAFEKYRKGTADRDHLSRGRKGQTQRHRQMISYARQNPEEQPDGTIARRRTIISRPAPRVSVQAFCETVETAAAVQSAGEDRRLGKAHLKIQMGGMAAAIEAYRTAPTPNVIILETDGPHRYPGRPRPARHRLRRRHPRHRDRPRQRRHAVSRTGAPRRQRLCASHRSTRSTWCARSAACFRRRKPRPSAASSPSSAPRAASAPPPSRTTSPGRSRATSRWIPSSPISTSPSAPPASTTTRIRRRASRMRCSRPTGSIPPSSTACCRNAPTISACSRRRRRSTGSTISAPTRSTRSSTRCAPPCPASCSTFRTNGRAGPSARWSAPTTS